MNLIETAIKNMETNIKERLASGKTTQEQCDKMHKDLDMPLEDFCLFQEMKSVASMDGTLSLDAAQTVYALLGEVPDTFNNRSLAEKYVLTQLLGELANKRIKAKQAARSA